MNIFDALYSLCKSHCKLKQAAWFISISYSFPFLLKKDKLYMCMDLLKGQKWCMCVFVLPSVCRTLRERLSVLLAKPLEILAGFWKAESDRTEITFDETETLCVPKTISEDGAASWISGCCFGCVRVDFCM